MNKRVPLTNTFVSNKVLVEKKIQTMSFEDKKFCTKELLYLFFFVFLSIAARRK